MTDLLSDLETPSDAELISRVRGGDSAAYGELFSRHVEAAKRLARQLARGADADDLVADAFAKVLQALQSGGGPDIAFRAYLLTSVRRLHVDRLRAASKLQTTDDMTQYDAGIPFQDTAVAGFEHGAAARAFASLPERWQLVLWHLEVEEQKPSDIAPLLGMSPNSVSALAYRAREGLRQAFLTMHLSDMPVEQCRWVNEHLGAYVRKGLSRRDTAKVEEHLDGCRRCMAMYLELDEVNSNLAGIIAPLFLGAAAAGYLSSTGAAGAGGLMAVVGRVRDAVAGHAGATTAGAVAAGVATATSVGLVIANLPDKGVVNGTDAPVSSVHTPGAGVGELGRRTPPAESPTGDSADDRTGNGAVVLPGESVVPAADVSPVAAEAKAPADASGGDTPPADSVAGESSTTTPDGREGGDDPRPEPTQGPTQEPSEDAGGGQGLPLEPPLRADLTITDLTQDGHDLLLSVAGVPDTATTISVRLRSRRTTFVRPGSDCPVVTDTRAECVVPELSPAARAAALVLPRGITAGREFRMPLKAGGDDPEWVQVTASLLLDGVVYQDPNPDDNSKWFRFDPADTSPADGSGTDVDDPIDPPADDPTDPPADDPTDPPADDPTDPPAGVDMALQAAFVTYIDRGRGDALLHVAVTDAPIGPLVLTLSAQGNSVFTAATAGCLLDPSTPDSVTCLREQPGDAVLTFSVNIPPGLLDSASLSVSAPTYLDPDEANNTVPIIDKTD